MRRCILLFALLSGLTAYPGKLPARMTCEQILANQGIAMLILQNVARFQQYPGNYALAANQILLELIAHYDHPAVDFVFMEKLFRKHGFPVWLIANSEAHDPACTIGYPPALEKIKNGRPARYWLWLEILNEEKAAAMKARLGITDEENLERLADAGLLMSKSVEDIDPANADIADEKTVEAMGEIRVRYPFRPENN